MLQTWHPQPVMDPFTGLKSVSYSVGHLQQIAVPHVHWSVSGLLHINLQYKICDIGLALWEGNTWTSRQNSSLDDLHLPKKIFFFHQASAGQKLFTVEILKN